MRQARPASALIVAATVSLLLAACGGGSAKAGHKSSGSATASDAVKFSECMRQHGLANFPDVIPGQGLPIQHELDGSIDIVINGVPQPVSGPAYDRASSACAKYMRSLVGHGVAPGKAGSLQTALVRTAACFRSHGVPNYPDPPALGTQQKGHFSPAARARAAGINIDSPAFKAALAKCGSILSNAMNRQ